MIAPCTESVVQPSPLAERPVVRRATFAAKPKRPHARKAKRRHMVHKQIVHKKFVHKQVAHKQAAHKIHKKKAKRRYAKRRPVAHRPAADTRPVLNRVTYASPLCDERTEAINDLIGLDSIDHYATNESSAAALPETLQNVDFGSVVGDTPNTGGGTTGPGFPGTPGFPGFPGGPIIIAPPGPPDNGGGTPPTPPVTPPVTVVPEPASWATMILGMGLAGASIRRRRRADRRSQRG